MACMLPIVKYGGFLVMVWKGTWSTGHSNLLRGMGNINSEKYIFIQQKSLLSIFIGGYVSKNSFLFMENGIPFNNEKKNQELQVQKCYDATFMAKLISL